MATSGTRRPDRYAPVPPLDSRHLRHYAAYGRGGITAPSPPPQAESTNAALASMAISFIVFIGRLPRPGTRELRACHPGTSKQTSRACPPYGTVPRTAFRPASPERLARAPSPRATRLRLAVPELPLVTPTIPKHQNALPVNPAIAIFALITLPARPRPDPLPMRLPVP